MIQIAICDDETRVLSDLKIKIQKEFEALNCHSEIFSCEDSFLLVEHIRQAPPDVLFLDIDMPKPDGMEIARFLTDSGSNILLVFVTSHDTLVYQSFIYHPFGFIRKSYFDEEIGAVVQGIIKELQKQKDYFSFKTNKGFCRIPVKDILYLESEQNYIILHSTECSYRFRSTIASVENELTIKGFIRTHKGFLVNSQHIFRVCGDDIELDNNEILPIGRTNRERIKKAILRYMR